MVHSEMGRSIQILDDSQFQPPQVYVEGTWLYGAFVTAILYGIVVVLYGLCTRSLWARIRSRDTSQRKQTFLLIYVNFVFALSTVFVVANCQIIQVGFINNRDYPGGPSAYETNISSTPLNISFIISNWCADALIIWRCIVVYRDSAFHSIVTVFGCLMLVASVVTGTLWVIIASRPAQSGVGWMSFSFLFPYLAISLGINIIICLLTVLRLLYYRACMTKAFGREYGTLYASFATMIIESATVYSVCSSLYLIPYAVNNPLANAFSQILGEAQVVALLLIIYRVAEGKAWTRDMTQRLAESDSYVLHGLSAHAASQLSGAFNAQVPLQGSQHTEYGRSVKFADENKDSAV